MSVTKNDIDGIIELIYDAAIKPEHWPELLDAVAELTSSSEDECGENSLLDGIGDSHALNNDGRHSVATVSLTGALKQLPAGLDSDDSEAIQPQSLAERTQAVNQLLLRHFKRALLVTRSLLEAEENRERVASLLDQLPIALIIVDESAQILEFNGHAKQLLDDRTGLHNDDGRLCAVGRTQNQQLQALIKSLPGYGVTQSSGHALNLNATREDEDDLMIFINPIQTSGISEGKNIAVFVSQRKFQPPPLPETVAALYKLSPKETAVARLLIQGHSIKEIAESTKITKHTVRSHVKSILSKTGTKRQAELVSLVLTGPGSYLSHPANEVRESENIRGLLNKAGLINGQPNFLTLSDGRMLAYQEYGDPSGIPVLHFHSVLGCRLEVALNGHEVARIKGVRLIVPDRPGTGCSDPLPNRTFPDWATDLAELVDYLGLDKFSIVGYAMGAQYALACASSMGDRVTRLALVCSGAPAETAEEYAQIMPFYRMNLKLARDLPSVHRMLVNIMRRGILSNPEKFFQQLSKKLSKGDAQIFEHPEFRTSLFAGFSEAVRQNALTIAMDAELLMRPWKFDLSSIDTPISMWHGDSDHHVPLMLAEKLVRQLKKAI